MGPMGSDEPHRSHYSASCFKNTQSSVVIVTHMGIGHIHAESSESHGNNLKHNPVKTSNKRITKVITVYPERGMTVRTLQIQPKTHN